MLQNGNASTNQCLYSKRPKWTAIGWNERSYIKLKFYHSWPSTFNSFKPWFIFVQPASHKTRDKFDVLTFFMRGHRPSWAWMTLKIMIFIIGWAGKICIFCIAAKLSVTGERSLKSNLYLNAKSLTTYASQMYNDYISVLIYITTLPMCAQWYKIKYLQKILGSNVDQTCDFISSPSYKKLITLTLKIQLSKHIDDIVFPENIGYRIRPGFKVCIIIELNKTAALD